MSAPSAIRERSPIGASPARRLPGARLIGLLALAGLFVLAAPPPAAAAKREGAHPKSTVAKQRSAAAHPKPGTALLKPAALLPAHRAWAGSSAADTARPASPAAASVDTAFANARRAFLAGDRAALEQAARGAIDHPLADYLPFWQLSLALRAPVPPADTDGAVAAFLDVRQNPLLVDSLRKEWIRSLARRERWNEVAEQGRLWLQRDELAVQCLIWTARLVDGGELPAEAREHLLSPRELGDNCNQLMTRAAAAGRFTQRDLLARLRVSAEVGAAVTARRAASLLGRDGGELEAAYRDPQRTVERGARDAEALAAAYAALARQDAESAAARLAQNSRLPADVAGFAWAVTSAQAAQQMNPQAAAWARQGVAARVSDETRGWMVRAALAARDWPLVADVITGMSESGRREPAWTYWLARAWQATGKAEQARPLFASIAGQMHFYGQLAAEEIGTPVPLPTARAPLTTGEIAEAQGNAGIQRALRFYDLGMRPEGHREWNFQLRDASDRQLLAIADLACRRAILDRCVNTADRTRVEHDFAMRFLSPFRDRLTAFAKDQELDPAWVYGLIRQESRFQTEARSHAGAQGLMQIMPATGDWIARQMGQSGFRRDHLHQIDTNLKFGTFYLRDVANRLGQSEVLASAGYNAGPGRPARWRQVLSGVVDGAAFAEIIPFTETRDYVKKVMWNTHWYASLFRGGNQSLKQRMGSVSPRPGATSPMTSIAVAPAASMNVPVGRMQPAAADTRQQPAARTAPAAGRDDAAADAREDRSADGRAAVSPPDLDRAPSAGDGDEPRSDTDVPETAAAAATPTANAAAATAGAPAAPTADAAAAATTAATADAATAATTAVTADAATAATTAVTADAPTAGDATATADPGSAGESTGTEARTGLDAGT